MLNEFNPMPKIYWLREGETTALLSGSVVKTSSTGSIF